MSNWDIYIQSSSQRSGIIGDESGKKAREVKPCSETVLKTNMPRAEAHTQSLAFEKLKISLNLKPMWDTVIGQPGLQRDPKIKVGKSISYTSLRA